MSKRARAGENGSSCWELLKKDLPLPELNDGEVLVAIAGCGVCGTDLGYLYHGVPTVVRPPLILGHEISGTVVAGDPSWLGKEVIVPTILPCRECVLCRTGRANRRLRQKMPGNSCGVYGGFASHIPVPSRELCPVPPRGAFSLEQLAVVADAVATPYQAALRGRITPGDRVIIIGVNQRQSWQTGCARAGFLTWPGRKYRRHLVLQGTIRGQPRGRGRLRPRAGALPRIGFARGESSRPVPLEISNSQSRFFHYRGGVKILFIGDIVGEPGRRAVRQILPQLRQRYSLDAVIANGENSAGGSGITVNTANDIFAAGVDIITSGDHLWDQKEVNVLLETEPRFLRPLNYPPGTPGQGSAVFRPPDKPAVGVLNLQGRTFMPVLENPFLTGQAAVERLRQVTKIILVDMHCEATSEKISLARMLDGQVSAVVGTHTHVQTADEQIFPGGTAFLCDAGFTGPHESVLGREIDPVIRRFLTSQPQRFEVAKERILLQGALIEVDDQTARAVSIQRISEPLPASEAKLPARKPLISGGALDLK